MGWVEIYVPQLISSEKFVAKTYVFTGALSKCSARKMKPLC